MLEIANFIWRGSDLIAEAACSEILLDGHGQELCGQYAVHTKTKDGQDLLFRDPLGVNKLFFTVTRDGKVESSNYLINLIRAGHAPAAIYSVRSGHYVLVNTAERSLTQTQFAETQFNEDENDRFSQAAADSIRAEIEGTFHKLRKVIGKRPLYVTMSGGLDSTAIAVLAREILGEFTGVTFRADTARDEGNVKDDLYFARKVAAELKVPFEEVRVSSDELLELLDVVLLYGQDWRDFNVHCGAVNAALGRYIHEKHRGATGDDRPILLTGDTMNELMADYSPVSLEDREYYTLPNVPPGALRRFLVQGLDTGDREVGIFAHYDLDTIQPYAMCAQAYASVPSSSVQDDCAKQEIVRLIMGSRVPSYIYDRPKVRAQVACEGEVGGTLGVFADAGLDDKALASQFMKLFSMSEKDLRRVMRAGVYRFATKYPEG